MTQNENIYNLCANEIYLVPIDFEDTSETLTFSPTISQVSIRVNITNDNRVEDTEYFFGNLVGVAGLVMASPEIANVTITEDTTDSE